MVKLPSGVLASDAARLPNPFIFFWSVSAIVQFHLHWASHIVAELSPLVLYKPV
jgi:hypothetical protein